MTSHQMAVLSVHLPRMPTLCSTYYLIVNRSSAQLTKVSDYHSLMHDHMSLRQKDWRSSYGLWLHISCDIRDSLFQRGVKSLQACLSSRAIKSMEGVKSGSTHMRKAAQSSRSMLCLFPMLSNDCSLDFQLGGFCEILLIDSSCPSFCKAV